MARVDPFVIQWPQKWVEDPEISPVVNYLNIFLHDLWVRSGGGEDLIESAEQAITSSNSRVSRNGAKIDSLEDIRFRVVPVTSDYTASPFEIVECNNTSPITITLEPNALIEDQIYVKRKQNSAKVTVIGPIDGDTSRVINIKKWADFYVFGATEWMVI